MAKKEKSAIEAILELKNKKNKKMEEKVAKLKAEKAKVEARIKKAEAEERAKTEKGIEAIYSKISKEIKNKSGIIPGKVAVIIANFPPKSVIYFSPYIK